MISPPFTISEHQDNTVLEHLLSIFVITYNRVDDLRITLRALKQSRLSRCDITVLDNCSTDTSPGIVAEETSDMPNFRYVRNVTNIGPSANALQSFLLTKKAYTWVLCDDDHLCFDHIDDVVAQIRFGQTDMILVGGHKDPFRDGARCTGTPSALMKAGLNFFRDSSFLPSTIYRSEFARQNISACYDACHFNYPHMALALYAYRHDLVCYVSEARLVVPSVGTQSYSRKAQLLWWYAMAQTIVERPIRRLFLTSQFAGPLDPSGLYGLLNTALRFGFFGMVVRMLPLFGFATLHSIIRMLRARMRGVRYEC